MFLLCRQNCGFLAFCFQREWVIWSSVSVGIVFSSERLSPNLKSLWTGRKCHIIWILFSVPPSCSNYQCSISFLKLLALTWPSVWQTPPVFWPCAVSWVVPLCLLYLSLPSSAASCMRHQSLFVSFQFFPFFRILSDLLAWSFGSFIDNYTSSEVF